MTTLQRVSDFDFFGLSSIGALALLMVVSACDKVENEASGSTAQADDTPVAVKTAPVEKKTLPWTIESPTTLAPSRTLRVTPEVGGVAEKIYRDQGESVERGDPLVRIASADYSLAVESARSQRLAAKAGLKQAKARLETARKQYERFQKLYEDDVVAKAEFEKVETAFEQAKAGYESAKAQAERASTGVKQAETRVGDTVIRAPFDGHVVQRMVDEGSVLRPMASPVMVIVDDDPIRAKASVGELKVPDLREGMEAAVRLDAFPDETFEGKVTMINRQINPRTREASIRVVLPNKEGKLRTGMSGTITIELGSRDRVVVPRRALFDRKGSTAAVYVVESGTAHRRTVEIEAGFEEKLPVTKGLSEGDQVVTWGIDQVHDGSPVNVKSSGNESSGEESSDNEEGSP